MLYQLPNGETIDISIDEYLAVSDDNFDKYVRSGKFTSKINIQLSHNEYNGESYQRSEVDWSNYQDDNEIELCDNRTLNQIIDDMPEDNPE